MWSFWVQFSVPHSRLWTGRRGGRRGVNVTIEKQQPVNKWSVGKWLAVGFWPGCCFLHQILINGGKKVKFDTDSEDKNRASLIVTHLKTPRIKERHLRSKHTQQSHKFLGLIMWDKGQGIAANSSNKYLLRKLSPRVSPLQDESLHRKKWISRTISYFSLCCSWCCCVDSPGC